MRPIGQAARSLPPGDQGVRAPGLRVGALGRFTRGFRKHANYHRRQKAAGHDAPGVAGFACQVRDTLGVCHLAMGRERDRRAVRARTRGDAAGEAAHGERPGGRSRGAEVPRAGAAEIDRIARLTPRSSATRISARRCAARRSRGRAFSMTVPHCGRCGAPAEPKNRSNTGGNCVSILVTSTNSSYSFVPQFSQYHWKPSSSPGLRVRSITRPIVFAGRRGECGMLGGNRNISPSPTARPRVSLPARWRA